MKAQNVMFWNPDPEHWDGDGVSCWLSTAPDLQLHLHLHQTSTVQYQDRVLFGLGRGDVIGWRAGSGVFRASAATSCFLTFLFLCAGVEGLVGCLSAGWV